MVATATHESRIQHPQLNGGKGVLEIPSQRLGDESALSDLSAPDPVSVLLATDTMSFQKQINGVSGTLGNTKRIFDSRYGNVQIVSAADFPTIVNPLYPEVPIALPVPRKVSEILDSGETTARHLATEGPVGMQFAAACLWRGLPFTTQFSTHWPKYMQLLAGVPEQVSWKFLHLFHRLSSGVMVPSLSMLHKLEARNFRNLRLWSRGIDFNTYYPPEPGSKREEILLYVGRVSVEKGVGEFLACRHPGLKVVVGDGPERARLEKVFKNAVFTGYLKGKPLADMYRKASVFVFPSRTDTLGNVLLEAQACGLPVATYLETGGIDVITTPGTGCAHSDLDVAIERALLNWNEKECVENARRYTWERATKQFRENLVPCAHRPPRSWFSKVKDFVGAVWVGAKQRGAVKYENNFS